MCSREDIVDLRLGKYDMSNLDRTTRILSLNFKFKNNENPNLKSCLPYLDLTVQIYVTEWMQSTTLNPIFFCLGSIQNPFSTKHILLFVCTFIRMYQNLWTKKMYRNKNIYT